MKDTDALLQTTESCVFHGASKRYSMFGWSLRISTVICAIKGPGVIRHMNAEAALTAAARQRIAQPSACNCHRSVVLFLWLWEMEVFEDGDKAGVEALSATASLSCSIRKQGNPSMRHARQRPLEQPQPLFNCKWFTERFPWFASVCMFCVIRHAVILRSWLSLLRRARWTEDARSAVYLLPTHEFSTCVCLEVDVQQGADHQTVETIFFPLDV